MSPVTVEIRKGRTQALLTRKTFLSVSNSPFPANTRALFRRCRVLLCCHRPSNGNQRCARAQPPLLPAGEPCPQGHALPSDPGPSSAQGIWPCQGVGNDHAALASPLQQRKIKLPSNKLIVSSHRKSCCCPEGACNDFFGSTAQPSWLGAHGHPMHRQPHGRCPAMGT